MRLLTVASMEFLVQTAIRVPGEPDQADLHCIHCGRISEVPLEWLTARPGDYMGCNHCGVISRLPAAQPIGA